MPTFLREGTDASIIACGVEVGEAMKAAEILAEEGISVEVIDAFSIKPFDIETIVGSVSKTGCAVVAEEHSVYGGLCSAVSEALVQHHPVHCEFIGMKDTFGKSGSFDELMELFELDASAIVEAVKRTTNT